MSVLYKVSYLFFSILLLSQDRMVMIFTVKFEMNNLALTLKDSCEGQSNCKIDDFSSETERHQLFCPRTCHK